MKEKIYRLYQNIEKPYKKEWILLFAILGFLFVSYCYTDLMTTTRHGIDFWTVLFNGRFFYFYEDMNFVIDGSNAIAFAFYDIPIYIIFALWNFPLWVLETFFGVAVLDNVFCLLYAKGILILFLAMVLKVLIKICQIIKVNEKDVEWFAFIFLSSPLLLSSLFVISQYDIIALFFILLGVFYFLKEENKKFIFWFAIAIMFKAFALFVFIPLLLLKEKRILYIIKHMVMAIIPTLLCKMLFMNHRGDTWEGEELTQASLAMGKLVKNEISISIDVVYIAILIMILTYIYCYWKQTKDQKDFQLQTIYISFLGLAVFFLTAHTHPQWIILLLPFLTILLLYNTKQTKLNLLLETIMSGSLIVAQMLEFTESYNLAAIKPMIWPAIFDKVENLSVQLDINSVIQTIIRYPYIKGVMITIFAAAMIALIIINRPYKSKEEYCNVKGKQLETDRLTIDRGVVWFRLFVGTALCSMQVLLYFISVILSRCGVSGEDLSHFLGNF